MNLVNLMLDDNKLKSLPGSIGRLRNLNGLDLAMN